MRRAGSSLTKNQAIDLRVAASSGTPSARSRARIRLSLRSSRAASVRAPAHVVSSSIGMRGTLDAGVRTTVDEGAARALIGERQLDRPLLDRAHQLDPRAAARLR